MGQSIMLRAKGLHTFANSLSEIPQGALARADNVVIDREGVIESRRGLALYGNSMASIAKQLLRYKTRVLRHFGNTLQYDSDGAGTWLAFNGSYSEVDAGLRIKGTEANGNFYFTTSNGVKKISALTAADFTTASGFITAAGGIKAIDVEGSVNYENPGFFTEESKVAYRVVWGIRDANNNVILGSPSPRLVLTNPDTTLSGTADLTINIPIGVTVNHFYQIYRSAVKEAGALSLDEVDPGDELNLVIEDFPTATDISNGYVDVSDITPDDFRSGGAFLYTNPVSGDGILQANEQPPLCKDIALFKGSTYYANTTTLHRQTIGLLSVIGFVSDATKFVISNGTITHTYTFRGRKEITQFTFDTQANTTDGSYFILYSANDERKYVVWFDKTGTTPAPTGPDTDGGIFIEVDISAAVTANDVASAVKTAMDAADNGDFTYSGVTSPLSITTVSNGNVANAAAGAVPPGGVFAIAFTQQGQGEDAGTQKVLLSDSASVAQAVDETARSLVRIINKQSNEIVYAYYISGPEDIPGQILLESRSLTDIPFYLALSDVTLVDKWNPTLPAYKAITALSQANPTVITSATHGLTTGEEIVLADSNSVPDADGIYTVTVIDANTFSVPFNVATTAGTSGIWFRTTAESDNEVSPNRIFYSKYQQPEAVPIVNYQDVGPKDQPIVRILPLRDSLIILKTDGVYRLTAEDGQTPTVNLIDSSIIILAADSAAVLNNLIYVLSSQGVAAVSDSGASIISRDIENQILKLTTVAYENFATASWALGYESDRAYLLSMVSEPEDETATQCFRYNVFTDTWTKLLIEKTCGVIGVDDRLYVGAADVNYIERERKNFDRTDYADREFTAQILAGGVVGDNVTLGSVTGIDARDVILQTQYVTISQFNRLLLKLDIDAVLSDSDYYSTLALSHGGNLTTKLAALVVKLNADDASRNSETFTSSDVDTGTDTITIASHGFTNTMIVRFSSVGTLPAGLTAGTVYYIINATTNTFKVSLTEGGAAVNIASGGSGTHTVTNNYYFSNSVVFATIQTEYNYLIDQLNASTGVMFSNYLESVGTVGYEVIVLSVNRNVNLITASYSPPWIVGSLTVFKGIPTRVDWAPQSMQDPSVLKHVSEGTVLFENNAFYSASVSYRSDLSRNFQEIEFLGFEEGLWGSFEWNEVLWGGEGSGAPFRTLIPQQKQRCRYMDCSFAHLNAREKYSLYGLSLTYEVSSSRAYR